MTSTYTTNKSIEKPANGDYNNTWSTPVNSDWDVIDIAFGGKTTLTATSLSGVQALSVSQYRPPIIIITGVLTANVNYQLPSGVGGFWYVYNNTTGSFTVTFSSAGGGSSVTLAQGAISSVISDGISVTPSNTNQVTASGSTTEIQYNNAGYLGSSSLLTWDGTYLSSRRIKITGSTSGFVGLAAAAAAGSTVYTLPSADGTAGQVLSTNGSAVLSWTTVTSGGTGVTSFSAGTTGLTPASASTGGITLAGTLNIANGGTGATTQAGAQTALNVPSTSGSGATGTWSISISGNATTATTAAYATTVTGTAFAIGYRQIPQSTNTTAAASDVGKHIYTSSGVTITSGVFSVGDAFVIVNSSNSATMSIIQGGGTSLILAGSTTTGTRTLSANGVANVLCVAANTFLVTGAGLS